MLSYDQKYKALAEDLWKPMFKGSLFDDEGNVIKQTGLSSGEYIMSLSENPRYASLTSLLCCSFAGANSAARSSSPCLSGVFG